VVRVKAIADKGAAGNLNQNGDNKRAYPMTKTKQLLLVALALVLLGGGYAIYYRTTTATAAETAEPPLQTAVVRQGNLTISAVAAGSVIAADSVDLSFSGNGVLIELLAQVGDTVQAGDLLARLDDADAQKALAQAQLQYAQSALQTDASASELGVSYNDISQTQAELNLAEAERALDALRNWQPDPDATAPNAQAAPTENQLMAAETAVAKAQLALQQTLLNRESQSLSLRQAQLNLTAAETALSKTLLVAPISGTVVAINKRVGEAVGSNTFLTLADLSQPMLELFLDETDLSQIAVGNSIEVVFNALPDATFTGQIVQVDPKLHQASGGISAVRAIARLNSPPPQPLPIGLNATVEVIGGRATNALLVPIEALREIAPGQYSLFVMENGEPRLRMVEVGLRDFSFAQILSGVTAGEEVTTGIVQTK
jgi:RND family efflux transporter MFP subunit